MREAKRQKLEEEGINPPRSNGNRQHRMTQGSRQRQHRPLNGPKGDILRHLTSSSMRGGNVEERRRKRERMELEKKCYPGMEARRTNMAGSNEEIGHMENIEKRASPKRT